ncbi:hypothetical protein MA794_003063 [Vibrio vulnificus]|nr:hypothetical protein [Vibrio vulnificus]
MPERDAKGRFVKGNRGNPNPVCRFAHGNLAAAKHLGYADNYILRKWSLYFKLTEEFYQRYPEGSAEDHDNYVRDNWISVIPSSWQVYRNKPYEK